MKFSEIANRLTGISTPFGGASWQPAELEIEGARRVLVFLEDRRVLYDPCEMEVPDHCVRSVIEIRHCLTEELGKLEGGCDVVTLFTSQSRPVIPSTPIDSNKPLGWT
jgi:hypothetical protein